GDIGSRAKSQIQQQQDDNQRNREKQIEVAGDELGELGSNHRQTVQDQLLAFALVLFQHGASVAKELRSRGLFGRVLFGERDLHDGRVSVWRSQIPCEEGIGSGCPATARQFRLWEIGARKQSLHPNSVRLGDDILDRRQPLRIDDSGNLRQVV